MPMLIDEPLQLAVYDCFIVCGRKNTMHMCQNGSESAILSLSFPPESWLKEGRIKDEKENPAHRDLDVTSKTIVTVGILLSLLIFILLSFRSSIGAISCSLPPYYAQFVIHVLLIEMFNRTHLQCLPAPQVPVQKRPPRLPKKQSSVESRHTNTIGPTATRGLMFQVWSI